MNMHRRWNLHYLSLIGAGASMVVFGFESMGHYLHPSILIFNVLFLIAALTDRQKV